MSCRLGLVLTVLAILPSLSLASPPAQKLDDWQQVVRNSPYWISRGAHANLATIRRWVLSSESYCEAPDRHVLFDRRGTFLGYVTDGATPEATQSKLNKLRQELAQGGRVNYWVPGQLDDVGYPFALSCFQPHAQLSVALDRYTGSDQEAQLWGTWDGITAGTPDAPISLHQAIRLVYKDRSQQGRVSLPPQIMSVLAGKVLIESAGQQMARSAAEAKGIMQLSSAALTDCALDERFHYHRLAQVDCALRLLEQNHRNLEPAFKARFAQMPEDKRAVLYSLLLIQAYHGGVGRISALLDTPAAAYFAEHHKGFTAADIALGLVFHNLGRNQIGFASLYYVVDVTIAEAAACNRLEDLPGC